MDQALLLQFAALEEAHWWFIVRRRLVLAWCTQWAPGGLSSVLEIGCGTGGTLRRLEQLFPTADVRGVEIDTVAAAISRSHGCSVDGAKMEQTPADDASVDLVVALDVLEHLADDSVGLSEMFRVLRPGGRMLLTVPAMPSLWGPHDVANAHYRRYTRRGLVEAVSAAGFALDRASHFNSFLMPMGWVERQITRLLRLKWSLGVGQPPGVVNVFLQGVFGLEIPLLQRVDLPAGMSLILVATKPKREVG